MIAPSDIIFISSIVFIWCLFAWITYLRSPRRKIRQAEGLYDLALKVHQKRNGDAFKNGREWERYRWDQKGTAEVLNEWRK
jgi:hypothetical protein